MSIKELHKNLEVRKLVKSINDENSEKESGEGRERGGVQGSDRNQNQNETQIDRAEVESVAAGLGIGGAGVKSGVCAFRLSESMALVHAREILALSNRYALWFYIF